MNLQESNVDGVQSFFSLFFLVAHSVVLPDLIYQASDMHEYFVAFLTLDEAEALRIIKKFNCSFFHCFNLFY